MSDIVPQQRDGSVKYMASEIELAEPAHADKQYEVARASLLDVDHWGNMSGFSSALFQQVDDEGRVVKNRLPMTGNFSGYASLRLLS